MARCFFKIVLIYYFNLFFKKLAILSKVRMAKHESMQGGTLPATDLGPCLGVCEEHTAGLASAAREAGGRDGSKHRLALREAPARRGRGLGSGALRLPSG